MTLDDFRAILSDLRATYGEDECWPWPRARTSRGYGTVNIDGVVIGAHRVAAHVALGMPRASAAHVLHRCDNPPCVNPVDLWLGTHAENMADCAAKGRMDGPRGPRALTAEQVESVRALRAEGWSLRRLADEFSVSTSPIRDALGRRRGQGFRGSSVEARQQEERPYGSND